MSQTHPLIMKSVPTLNELKAGFPGLKTLLFDMDGTLFDTEKYHAEAFQQIGRDHKIIPPIGTQEVHQLLTGKADHLIFDIIKEWPGFPTHWDVRTFVNEKNRYLLEILKKVDGRSYFPTSLKKLLDSAKNENFQVGLVTSSEKVITIELLKLSGLENFFAFVLTRDDSLKVKPDPWPYLKAMDHFKTDPSATLIFEDSTVGLQAALDSGAHRIKVEWF